MSNANNALELDMNIEFVDDWQDKVPDTDIVIIATNWTEYAGLTNMPEKIRDKTILDTRSLLSKDSLLNVKYITIN